MKTSNFKTVVFLTDFAGKKKGDTLSCDGMHASSMVRRGVARYKEAVTLDEDSQELQDPQEAPVQTDTETKTLSSKKKKK